MEVPVMREIEWSDEPSMSIVARFAVSSLFTSYVVSSGRLWLVHEPELLQRLAL